jgi:hypothetical protein
MDHDTSDIQPRLVAAATCILVGEYACHECGCFVPVFGLLVVGPFERYGDLLLEGEDDSALLRRPVDLPADVRAEVASRSGGHFRPAESKTRGERYWMNHCRECGAKIGDWFVHKPGEAFFPTSDEDAKKLQGFRLTGPHTFDDPDLALSTWTSSWLAMNAIK